MTRTILAAAAIAIATTAQAAAALPPLHQNQTVIDGFYAIGLADEVRKNCNSIQPRWLTAWNFLKSLESYALNAGYTEAQIKQLTRDKAKKELLRSKIRSDLAARGATPANPEGYCNVGREEIAKGSQAGKLLRAN